MSSERRGYTILEVMLVLAILVMLAAIAYPSIEAMYADLRLQAGADHLRGKLAQARAQAILDNRPYRFAVKPNTGDYRIAPDTPDQWDEAADPNQPRIQDDSAPAPLILEGTLPSDILFQFGAGSDPGSGGGWSKVVTFQVDGSCDDDRAITLQKDDCRPIEISIRSLTGAVTAKTIAGGSP